MFVKYIFTRNIVECHKTDIFCWKLAIRLPFWADTVYNMLSFVKNRKESEQMKVLQINSVCGYGSTGNIVVDLYRALKEQGHECCVAYGRGKAPEDVQSYRIGSDMEVYVHGVLSRITDKQGFYSTRATKRLVEWMKEYDPDVVHLHNLHGYYINIGILFDALKQMNKPVVWTLHDCWAFTGHCSHYTKVACDKWQYGCEKCLQKGKYPSSLLYDNSYWNYRRKKTIFQKVPRLTIVTPSQWLADEVRKSFLSEYPLKVIYNGVDLGIFQPTPSDFCKQYHLEDKKIILGVASEWSKEKGLHVFEELAEELDDRYQVVLVGLNQKQCSQVNRRIICIDRTSSKKKLAQIYTAADLFLNPSVEETMGLTTVEALACGTNVLVNNSTALPEIVDYDRNKIVSDKNICVAVENALKMQCDRIMNHRIAAKYEKGQQYMKYLNLYCELIKL